MKNLTARFGVTGVILTALLSPCCFPLFAGIAAAFGFGSAEILGGFTEYIFIAFVLVAVAGLVYSYYKSRNALPLLTGILGAAVIILSWYEAFPEWSIYAGMLMLLISVILPRIFTIRSKKTKAVITECVITCPHCGFKKTEEMPVNACRYFYECEQCKKVIKPKAGDCCMFCSYGTIKCPPMQVGTCC